MLARIDFGLSIGFDSTAAVGVGTAGSWSVEARWSSSVHRFEPCSRSGPKLIW